MRKASHGFADQAAMVLPVLGTVLLTILMASAVFAPVRFLPVIWITMVFFWRLYSPATMPYGWVFSIGLLHDALLGLPLGMHALALLIGALILERMARNIMRQTFRMVWMGLVFFVVCVFSMTGLLAIVMGTSINLKLFIVQALATMVFYPLVHALLSRCARLLPPSSLRG